MTQQPNSDELAKHITQLTDLIYVASNSDESLSLELRIAAMGFAARELCVSDLAERDCDPAERMNAIKGLFIAAFEHEFAATIATVETERAMRRMTGKRAD